MILGNINKINQQELQLFSEQIKKAINSLKETDFSKLEDGKHELDGENMFIVLQSYKTVPKSEKKAEKHEKYIDIQFMIKGKETIGHGFINPENKTMQEYDKEIDAELYTEIKNETDMVMTQGTFTILFPSDIHRPGCHLKTETEVRKAVVKILI